MSGTLFICSFTAAEAATRSSNCACKEAKDEEAFDEDIDDPDESPLDADAEACIVEM